MGFFVPVKNYYPDVGSYHRKLAHPAGLEPAPYGLEDRCPIPIRLRMQKTLLKDALAVKMTNASIKSLSSVAKVWILEIAADKKAH